MTERGDLVGYRRPPKHSRFKPGRSGNPTGRRKGRKNFMTELVEELSAKVLVVKNGRRRMVSMQTVIIKRTVADAANGDTKARDQLLRLLTVIEAAANLSAQPQSVTSAEDAEILARFRARLIDEIKAQERGGK